MKCREANENCQGKPTKVAWKTWVDGTLALPRIRKGGLCEFHRSLRSTLLVAEEEPTPRSLAA